MADTLIVHQSGPLSGEVHVPGDKSLSHRALIMGALARGQNKVRGWLDAGDTRATLAAIRALGIDVIQENGQMTFKGDGIRRPQKPLNCENAGTAMRLLAGVLAAQDFPSTLGGSPQLCARPMGRVIDPLRAMGARIGAHEGKAPLEFHPSRLSSLTYGLPVASAQVKSALLLAGVASRNEVVLNEPGPSRDHTERMLRSMGAAVLTEGRTTRLSSQHPPLAPLDMDIPGDISSAAFLIVAACLLPGSDLVIRNVGLNPTRTGILDILRTMGANIEILDKWKTGGEPAGDLRIRATELKGTHIEGDLIIRAIDELPVLTVAAVFAEGETSIADAAELRVKEVDRITAMVNSLRELGGKLEETPNGIRIEGQGKLTGNAVSSLGDHRVGMALAVAGLAASGETHINQAEAIDDSFPGFSETLAHLGVVLA